MRRTIRRLTLAAAASVALAGTARAQSQDIVGTAIGAGQFTTLAALLTDAGLVSTLQGTGPFTVFAPTDAAFAKVPAEAVQGLKADKKKLAGVLTYHVVPGKLTAADLKAKADQDGYVTLKTVEGSDLKLHFAGSTVHVGDEFATVVKADVPAKNGVIHVIDKVVMPGDHGAHSGM